MTLGRNIRNTLEQSLHVSVFVQVCFVSTFRLLKTDIQNNATFDAVSRKRANFDGVRFFKHIPKPNSHNVWHNLQTFKHNAIVNELLLMQFYLFNIRLKLYHRSLELMKITHHTVLNLNQLHQQPADDVLRPTFIWKLCYKHEHCNLYIHTDF